MVKKRLARKNSDVSVSNLSENSDELKKEEDKLKEEIEELKSIITQTNLSLNLLKFSNIQILQQTEQLDITNQSLSQTHVPDISVKLQNCLYKFSGFYCSKFTKSEYVFNFESLVGNVKENYAVQILYKDGKGVLGKWVLPMSVDIDQILSENPINNIKYIIPFLKSCKRHIECYFNRQEQFKVLQKSTENVKNFNIGTNMGYTQVNMEFMGIHDKIHDKGVNIIVYLYYNSTEIRPHQIKIDSTEKRKMSNKMSQELKQFFKRFKTTNLQEAYKETLVDKDHSLAWSEADDDTPLEINMTSSSEESLLDDIKETQKEKQKRRRSKRKLTKRHIKWKKQNIQVVSQILLKKDVSIDESNSSSVKKRSKQGHVTKKNTEYQNTSQKTKEIPKNRSHITITASSNSTPKLKQTKLNFSTTNTMPNDEKLAASSTKRQSTIEHKKKIDVISSTPLYPNKRMRLKESEDNLDISVITRTDEQSNQRTSNKSKGQDSKKTAKLPQQKLSKKKGFKVSLRAAQERKSSLRAYSLI